MSIKPTIILWQSLTKQQRRRVLGCCELTSTSTKVLYVSGGWFTFDSMQSELPLLRLGRTHFTPATWTLVQVYPFQISALISRTLSSLGNTLWRLFDPSTSTKCSLCSWMGWHQIRRRRWWILSTYTVTTRLLAAKRFTRNATSLTLTSKVSMFVMILKRSVLSSWVWD